jgi:Phage derived protein Gp49-like (DUF891)
LRVVAGIESAPPAARGSWGSIVWATDARGRRPAKDFYDGLSNAEKSKILSLFKRMADTGSNGNRVQFKKLKADLFEFKKRQIRLLGSFRGRQFVVAHGLKKKTDLLAPQDLRTAARILGEHDNQEGRDR